MLSELAKYILAETRNRQIILVILTLLLFPILYGMLHIPKVIINEAIGGTHFPYTLLGLSFEQVNYLILLSCVFFGLIIINAVVKYILNLASGMTTEITIANLRRKAYHHTMDLPLEKVQNFSSPELIQMMTTEIEPIGNFAGDIVALPFKQGGTLITILLFVFVQDFYLGLAAVSLFPLQAYLVPYFQRKVNRLIRERYRALQTLSEEIQDSFLGLEDVRSMNLGQRVRLHFDKKSHYLLKIRYRFYRQKFLLKFVNSLIGNIVPFLFYSIGGYFVITGDLTLGGLVSIMAAHKELQEPWMDLLNYYQRYAEADLRFRRLLKKIGYKDPLITPDYSQNRPAKFDLSTAEFVGQHLYFLHKYNKSLVDDVNFKIKPLQKIAIVSPQSQSENTFIKLLAGLIKPTHGDIYLHSGTKRVEPRKLLGTEMTYVSPQAHIFTGTIFDNLRLNSRLEFAPRPEILAQILPLLKVVHIEEDLYTIGLNRVASGISEDMKAKILTMRKTFRERVQKESPNTPIKFYEKESYNPCLSLGDNIVFGHFNAENLTSKSPDVITLLIKTLQKEGLNKAAIDFGYKITKFLLDELENEKDETEFFEKYCLIDREELEAYSTIMKRFPSLTTYDQRMLQKLTLGYIPEKHDLGECPSEILQAIPKLRLRLMRNAPADISRVLIPYDDQAYHPLLSVWENIRFGVKNYRLIDAQKRVSAYFEDIIQGQDFRDQLIELALDYHTGLAGKNLTPSQRQKISLARALLSHAQLMVFDKATAILDQASHEDIQHFVLKNSPKKGAIWLVHRPSLAQDFDHILVFKSGKIVEEGTHENLLSQKGEYHQLLELESKQGQHNAA